MLDLYDELKSLVAELEAGRVEYALCGGLALAVYDLPRATVDIDLLVPPASLPAAIAVAAARGYTVEAAPMRFAEGTIEIRRFTKTDPDSSDHLMLDLVVVTPALATIWEGRRPMDWEHGRLSVVSKEGLIRMKSLRKSGQDQDDIRRLEGGAA
ncbi:MAG: hypothetical protein V1809_12330 [Planctomycetota bacterium]